MAKKAASKTGSERGNWISHAVRHHGALHKDLGVPAGKKIPRKMILEAAGRRDLVGERARLALTLEHLK